MAVGSTVVASVAASISCLLISTPGIGGFYDTWLMSDEAPVDQEFIELVDELEKYVVVEDGVVIFDTEEAEQESASSEILNLGETLNDFSQAYEDYDFEDDEELETETAVITTASVIDVPQSAETLLYAPERGSDQMITAGVPIWGNWCGPGHGGGKAKDTLDSLCRTHDLCYGKKGYFACSCDRALVKGINSNASKMKSAEKRMAAVVSVYFKASPCNPFK